MWIWLSPAARRALGRAGLALLGALGCGSARAEDEVEGQAAALDEESAVFADDGSRYVVGVFSGTLRVGDVVLRSRGGDDVFLAHVFPNGRVGWARAMGSEAEERAPRVELDAGRLDVIAMTRGAVDCGRGELRSYRGEAFFLCSFDERGRPLRGGAFPTGRP